MRILMCIICTATLSACASNPQRLAKPIEAHGKILGSLSDSTGSQMENFTKSTRLSLINFSQNPRYYDFEDSRGEVENTVSLFRGSVLGERIDRSKSLETITPAREALVLSQFFICNPLNSAAKYQDHQVSLAALGKSLSKLSGKPPESVAGLIASLKKDYELEYKAPEDGKPKYDFTEVCKPVVEDALSNEPDELISLMQQNFNAIETGKRGGTGKQTGLGEIVALFKAIEGILSKSLTLAEQKARSEALKTFFENPENIDSLTRSIQRLDEAVNISVLGARLETKNKFRTSWARFKTAYGLNTGRSSSESQEKLDTAVTSLLSASSGIDTIIRSKAANLGKTNDTGCLNLASKGKTAKYVPCVRTSFGVSMLKSIDQMRIVATNDWGEMSAEQKVAYWDSVYANLKSVDELNTELQKFSNDKENFVKLNNVLDDLFR